MRRRHDAGMSGQLTALGAAPAAAKPVLAAWSGDIAENGFGSARTVPGSDWEGAIPKPGSEFTAIVVCAALEERAPQ